MRRAAWPAAFHKKGLAKSPRQARIESAQGLFGRRDTIRTGPVLVHIRLCEVPFQSEASKQTLHGTSNSTSVGPSNLAA